MTFERPLLLLALLAVPLAVGLYLLAERRRARYAVTFTNLEVLAAVAGGRSWRRLVPPRAAPARARRRSRSAWPDRTSSGSCRGSARR